MSIGEYFERNIDVEQRLFSIRVIGMFNGYFISISEDKQHRIGSLNVSLPGSIGVNTAKVIPSKYDSVFLNMISERVAALTNGICITSLYTKNYTSLCVRLLLLGVPGLFRFSGLVIRLSFSI